MAGDVFEKVPIFSRLGHENMGPVRILGLLSLSTMIFKQASQAIASAKWKWHRGAQCGAKFASNEALKSVSYPIQAGLRVGLGVTGDRRSRNTIQLLVYMRVSGSIRS